MGIFGSEFGSLDIIAEIRLIESKVEKTIVPYHRARRKVGQSVSPEGFVAMNAATQLLCQTLEQHHPLVIDQRRQEERLTRCLGTLFCMRRLTDRCSWVHFPAAATTSATPCRKPSAIAWVAELRARKSAMAAGSAGFDRPMARMTRRGSRFFRTACHGDEA